MFKLLCKTLYVRLTWIDIISVERCVVDCRFGFWVLLDFFVPFSRANPVSWEFIEPLRKNARGLKVQPQFS
jgi:hypothetical protein